MLDRIQLLVGDLRMVTDGVAHDLRSPLTRLRAHLDASLEEGLDEPTRRERIRRAIAEADGVLRTFAALMEIARAEAGMGRDQFEPIDLGALAEDVIDLYTPTAAEKGVHAGAAPATARPSPGTRSCWRTRWRTWSRTPSRTRRAAARSPWRWSPARRRR